MIAPRYVFTSAIIQRPVGSLGDVLQPVILGLEILPLVVDPLEGIFRKIPSGNIHVPPNRIPAGSGFRMMMRKGRLGRVGYPHMRVQLLNAYTFLLYSRFGNLYEVLSCFDSPYLAYCHHTWIQSLLIVELSNGIYKC